MAVQRIRSRCFQSNRIACSRESKEFSHGLVERAPPGAIGAISLSTRCPAFDNAESRLSTYKRHVVGHYGLGEALEGECANLFGYDASP